MKNHDTDIVMIIELSQIQLNSLLSNWSLQYQHSGIKYMYI